MIWEFEFEDGRRVIVYRLMMGTARAGLLDPLWPMSIDDSW